MNRNQGFYNLNESRGYPLDDRATRTGDAGERLPNGVLVDLALRFPEAAGGYAFLSALAVTDTLVTAVFLACPGPDAPPAAFAPLAAVTARRPVTPGRHYALDALAPGVGGWVVFGPADEKFRGRFSTPAQGLLLPRCARPYRALPVTGVRKAGAAAALTGVVRLRGGTDIEVVGAEREIDGAVRAVAVVRLKAFAGRRNVFAVYAGPCGGRPETGTCDREAVEFVNSVGPDCGGNLEIVLTGDTVATPYAGGGGIVLDHPLGLADVCTRADRLPDDEGRLPTEYDDACTDGDEGYEGAEDLVESDSLGEDPYTAGLPDVSSEYVDCPELPYRETFDDLDAEGFRVAAGAFRYAGVDSPGQETYDDWLTPSSTSSEGRPRGAYEAYAPDDRNVSVWDTCACETTVGKRVRADVQMLAGGGKLNAALVLNFRPAGDPPQDVYLVAEVDRGTDSVRLRRWNGVGFSTLGAAAGVGLKVNDWYRLTADVEAGPDPLTQTRITVDLVGVTDPGVTASLVAVTTQFLPGTGRFGLGTDQGVARFSNFEVYEL